MEQKVLLSLPLDVKDKKPPTSLRLLKMGKNDSLQGEFILTKESAALLMQRAKDWGNKFHFDWDHHAALTMKGVNAPAAAWYDLALREDGLYADNIEWTKKGAEDVIDGAYKYLSPNIDFNGETREVTRFNNAALTNLPAGKQLEALLSQVAGQQQPTTQPTPPPQKEAPTMDRKALLSALGLPEGSSEAELNSRVAELNHFKKHVLSSTGASSDVEAMGALLSMKGAQAEVERLKKEAEKAKADAIVTERTALLSKAVEDGLLEPGGELKKQLETQPPELVKALLSQLPSKTGGEKRPPADSNAQSSTEQRALLSKEQIAAAEKAAEWFEAKPEDVKKHWEQMIRAGQQG